MEKVTVICTRKYFDIKLRKEISKNQKIKVTEERAKVLLKEKVCELVSISKTEIK